METQLISFDKIHQFSLRDKAYQQNDDKLRQFVEYNFSENELHNLIEARRKFPVDRQLLSEEINRQYKSTPFHNAVQENIDALLNEDTFTVITAHQPSLLMGPLYYVYKICSAINVAKRWSEKGIKVVPVFIMGAEDHDLDEIDHFYLFNKEIKWERDQEGATGRMSIDGIEDVINKTIDILGEGSHEESLASKMKDALNQSHSYGEFMQNFINHFFAEYGVLTVNFDNAAFKKQFAPLIKKEITSSFSKPLVTKTQEELENKGFGQQAFVRDINFFYFTDKKRSRIEKRDNKYYVLETDISFSEDEMISEINNHPEKFSPNVVMRPLFQETIMPNLAYIGGGGELAYWMERKSQFEAANVFFPMLIRRKSAVWLNKRVIKSLDQLNLEFEQLSGDSNALIKSYALENTDADVEFDKEYAEIEASYDSIKAKASSIDPTLEAKLDSMKSSHIKALDKIQTRLVRAIKQKQEVQINKILKTRELLFPNNGLQERKTNFMEIYINHGQAMIDFLIENCNPFEKEMLIVKEN